MDDREQLTVLLPCYNEEASVVKTVESIQRVAKTLDVNVTILLIDDHSSDKTYAKMLALCQQYANCRVHANPYNMGLGKLHESIYPLVPDEHWICTMPGDNENNFTSIRMLLAHRHEYDLLLSYHPTMVTRTLSRRFLSYVFSALCRTLYGLPFRYFNGLSLTKAKFFKHIPIAASGFTFIPELIAKTVIRHPTLRIGEYPCHMLNGRRSGVTKAVGLRSILSSLYAVFIGYRSFVRYREQTFSEENTLNEPFSTELNES